MLRRLLFSAAEGKQTVKTKGCPGTAAGFNGNLRSCTLEQARLGVKCRPPSAIAAVPLTEVYR